jgi:hypothetical protein
MTKQEYSIKTDAKKFVANIKLYLAFAAILIT